MSHVSVPDDQTRACCCADIVCALHSAPFCWAVVLETLEVALQLDLGLVLCSVTGGKQSSVGRPVPRGGGHGEGAGTICPRLF